MARRSNTGSLNHRTLAAAVASCFAAAAHANPTAPTVMSGSATFSTLGNNFTITNSPGAIIHWQGFSIQANEITRFLQQNASSAVLNRVTGGNMSQLLGQLLSNGRVFLINPSGIVVGQGAVIDVAALVASSLNLSDADFLAGRYRFTNQIGAGAVINQGTITTPAGGQVYLVAPNVENHGVITAPSGEVILAAGRSVEIVNAGTPNIRVELTAPDGEALNLGEVVAQAGRVGIYGASVRNAGRVSANTAVVGENGKIVFKATGSVSLDAGSRAETTGPGTGEIEISAGENLTVRGVAQSGGTMAVDVAGDLSVISDTAAVPPQPIGLRAQTGQTIQARSIAVTSTGGIGSIASIMNLGGDQTISVAGGDVDVRSLGSGIAQISNFGPGSQVISVSGGNHVAVDGAGGRAAVESFGSQSLSLSGGGANALVVGSANGQGASAITGVGQTITVGAGGEAGSITITGPAAPGAATTLSSIIENRGGAASTQNISTSGAISIIGGTAPAHGTNTSSGISNLASAQQTINAASLLIQGGSSGTNNTAAVTSIAIQGSGQPSGNQQVNVSGDISLIGGAGGSALLSSSGAQQTVTARDITLLGGLGGVASAAAILAPRQTIIARDVTLTARDSAVAANGALPGARIGGNGGATDLELRAANVTLNGGTGVNNGVGLGSSGAGTAAFANNIRVDATGNVTLNGGTATGTTARIGTGNAQAPAAGDIRITAGGDILLNGGTGPAVIRTAGDVALTAANMNENANGSIVANKLTLKASGNANLGGPNQVSALSAPSAQPAIGGSLTFNNNGSLNVADTVSSGGMMTLTVAGALNVNGNGVLDAQLLSFGGQNITAHEINLTASNNRRSTIQNTGGAGQSITATAGGMNLQALGGSGVAQIINSAPGASQTLSMTGLLNVLGGRTTTGSFNSGVFQNVNGLQSVTSSGIVLQAASTGTPAAPSGASISSAGSQVIDAGSGNINMASAAGGNASISAGSTANQAATQTISAHDISLANGTGGINGAATILGPHQTIHATGDVTLTAQAGVVTPGNLAGIRIGGNGTPGTDLTMTVGGALTLTGGSAPENAASIGSSGAGAAGANNITISAGGNVTLTGGTAPGSVARIGTGTLQAPSAGDITITSTGGSIQLDGTTQTAAIRTAGNVTLSAVSMSETGNGFIQANVLNTTSGGDTSLIGPNQVASFSGTAGGNLTLNNAGPLVVQAINSANAALTNAGSVAVRGSVTALGTLNLSATGALSVEASGTQDAIVSSFGGQTISAQSLSVTAQDGRTASLINNASGDQTITIAGGGSSAGVDVRTLAGGGTASIVNNVTGASQKVAVTDADHIDVIAGSGATIPGTGAFIRTLSGTQTVSITGSGANAIRIGDAASSSASDLRAQNQTVVAGLDGQSGSIAITGPTVTPGAGALAGIVSQGGAGSTQTVSTSGTLSVTGGGSANQLSNFQSGIFHNGTGLQSISAGDIVIQGGATGANNGAFISTAGNPAGLHGDQLVNVVRDISVSGGAGGSASITGGRNRLQTVNARNITVTNPLAGGTNSGTGTIVGTTQTINASGDVTLTARSGSGLNTGVRVGGASYAGVNVPTDLTLNVGGNLTLNGGTAPNNGVGIGSASAGTVEANNIHITTGGNVVLNSGTTSGAAARIGSSFLLPGVAGGDISVVAGGDIQLNGGASPVAIRTTGNVALTAANISETGDGSIQANNLRLRATGSANLGGPNQVTSLSAPNVLVPPPAPPGAFLPGVSGNLTFNNNGSLNVADTVSSGGMMTLTVAGALNVNGNGVQDAQLLSFGGQSITAQSINLTASNNLRSTIQNVGGAGQSITATAGGMNLQALGGSGVAQIINSAPGASQILNMTGLLNVLGGTTGSPTGSRNSGVFQNANGLQSISSTGIVLQASAAGTNPAAPSGAFITAALGDQVINAGGGDISLSGAGGAGNNAGISSLGNQTINARNISLTNGAGGSNSVATIIAPHQTINATGDVTLTAQSSTPAAGLIPGVRIGGNGGATDLTLRAVNVTLNGGTAADNGVGIGSSSVGTAFANDIRIDAGGNVILNGGTAPGTNVRIGTGTLQPAAAGNIAVTAGGDIQLNGAAGAAAIRTTGNVALTAVNMSETGNGFIDAGGLTLRALGSANLGGQNQVSSLSAPFVPAPPPAPPGASLIGVGGNLTFNNNGSLNVADTVSSGGLMTLTVAGALNVNGNGLQDAQLLSFGGQNITAQSINLTASNNRRANIENRGIGNQSITATAGGVNLIALGGSGVAQIVNSAPGASQTLSMSGLLNVLGGTTGNPLGSRSSGVFQNANGMQSVTASGILLQASPAGTNPAASSSALISSAAGGDQFITVVGGTISLNAANGGTGNGATISSTGNQTISGNADIVLNGGSGGNAAISSGSLTNPGATQSISAHNISLANSAAGGTDSAAVIAGTHQTIHATGDVTLAAGGSGGTVAGARIGGLSGTPAGSATDLDLTVGGNLTLTGGTAANNGVGIGSSAAGTAQANSIRINAGGSVVLNSGSEAGTGARIGAGSNGNAGGTITVTAGGSIQLNGTAQPTAIRTTGDVSLTAASISEASNGFIVANALTTSTSGDTSLTGPNQVVSFRGTSTGGSITLNNGGPLAIAGINAANAALVRAASVSGSGAISTGSGFTVDVSAVSDLNGVISGAGGLNKNGVGFLTLGAVNTYAGDTNVNAGTLALGAADQTTTGNINIAGGATFRGSPGTYTNAGVIGGDGTLDVSATSFTSSGTLRPGGANAIGTLTVQGNAVIDGLLDIEAQGSGAGNHDVLAVTGAATLGGTLNVTPINGYAPQGGDTLVPLTFASRSGALEVSPADWSSTYNPTNLTLGFSPLNRWTAASGNWDLASNWSLGHVPTNFERVLIDVPGSQFVTVSRGSQAADRLTSFENFILSGGSLNLGGPSTFNGSFSLLGGELKGNGDVAINGAFVWAGGRMSGAGRFLTSAGSVSLLSPLLDDDLSLGKSWTNRGTVQWIGLRPGSIKGSGSIQNEGTFSFDGRNAVVETPFGNSGTLNVDTNVDLKLSSQNAGTINVAAGVKLKVHGTYTNLGRLTGKGTLDLDGGKLVNLGTLAPGANGGNGIGTFTVQGDFQQGATGLLEIDLGGTHVGQYDVLDIEGKATLGGSLFVRAANGYVPRRGDDFKLVTYKSRVGTFEFLLPPPGFALDADYGRKVASFELD